MPSPVTEFRIVLSSPGELGSDRDAVESAIKELNHAFGQESISLRVVGWENDVVIGQGDYPQAVVSEQLLPNCDILIGLIGLRLGTPTPNAPSGTVEEIRIALKRAREENGFPHVLVFFKDSKISALDSDPDELKRIKEFSLELKEGNVLYSRYETPESLMENIRIMISKIVLKHRSASGKKIIFSKKATISDLTTDSHVVGIADGDEVVKQSGPEDWGLLDSVEESKSTLEEAAIDLTSAAEEIQLIGGYVEHCTITIQKISPSDPKKLKAAIDQLAEQMQAGAKNISMKLDSASESFAKASDAIFRMIMIQKTDFGEQGESTANEMISQLDDMLRNSLIASHSVRDFNKSILDLPRMTSRLNKAKHILIASNERFFALVDEMNSRVAKIKTELS